MQTAMRWQEIPHAALRRHALSFCPPGKGDAAFGAAGLMGDGPTPALRDRVKSSQDFTFAPPLPERGFSRQRRRVMNIRTITSWGLALFALWAQAAQGQNLEDLVQRLVRQTDTLAQRSYDSFSSRRNPSRYDIEALYQSRSLNASAELFQRMVRDRRGDSELKDAFAVLQDLLRNSGRYAFEPRYWSDIQRTSDDLARELNVRQGDRDEDRPPRNDPDGHTSGRLRWHGKVDGETQLLVRRSDVESRALSGLPARATTFDFTSPLPRRAVDVRLEKKHGRGDVEIVQQPSRNNDFTVVVEIRDKKGGSDDYEFELIW